MSAQELRQAAALMRERAEAATPGPWVCYGDMLTWPSEQGPAANDPVFGGIGPAHDDSAAHIASWHPAVAVLVADLLDDAAENLEMQSPGGDLRKNWDMRVHIAGDKALDVARAYLGSES